MIELEHDNNWKLLDKISIEAEQDIVKARQQVRFHAKNFGMGIVDQTRITTACSELFRNMFQYADGGIVEIETGLHSDRMGLIITCKDNGQGIEDLNLALEDGYSSGNGMGLGLPGAKRLVDDFIINTKKGEGTTIRIIKWK